MDVAKNLEGKHAEDFRFLDSRAGIRAKAE